jgi:type VI secretion system protein ImpF
VANDRDIRPDQPLLTSVLDRLLDEDAGLYPERSARHNLAELQTGLRRDIEMLLNTHQYCKSLPRELTELNESMLDYGMPHFLGLAATTAAAREQLRATVESVLRRFEPRLKQVKVTLPESSEAAERTLHFRIDALLIVDPEPEPVSFDSVLEPAQQRFRVKSLDV